MNYRLFSKKHNLYTNSPLWPSNQRTWSEWVLAPNGKVIELVDAGACGYSVINHDKRNFSIEPWTGFFDSKGQKIYLGDIVKLQCFNLDYEIVWHVDRFGMKPMFESLCDGGEPNPDYIRGQKDFSVDWLVFNTKHGVKYEPLD